MVGCGSGLGMVIVGLGLEWGFLFLSLSLSRVPKLGVFAHLLLHRKMYFSQGSLAAHDVLLI